MKRKLMLDESLVIDRFDGLGYELLALKYRLRNANEARRLYLSKIDRLAKEDKSLRRLIIKRILFPKKRGTHSSNIPLEVSGK